MGNWSQEIITNANKLFEPGVRLGGERLLTARAAADPSVAEYLMDWERVGFIRLEKKWDSPDPLRRKVIIVSLEIVDFDWRIFVSDRDWTEKFLDAIDSTNTIAAMRASP